jgi:hypothetical protein
VANLLSDLLVVPLPDIGSDGLSDGSENTEGLHLLVDVVVTGTLQQTESGGSNVELSDLVLVDDVPVAGEVGVGGGSLENESGDSQNERSVDTVGVPGNPTDITSSSETVTGVKVEDVLSGHGGTEKVSSGGVHDSLGLSGGSGSVEKEERVLGGHELGGDVSGVLGGLLVPPDIASLDHWDLSTCAAEDNDVADVRAGLKSLVNDSLGSNNLSSTLSLIGGDDNSGVGIEDTVTERLGRETGEDDGVDGTDTDNGQQCDECLGDHGHVDGDGVSLLDSLLLQDVGELGDLSQKLTVGDGASLGGLIGLVDDGGAVGVLESVSVDGVVTGVQASLKEPADISVLERSVLDGLEGDVPGEELAGLVTPELLGVLNGLLVLSLVLVESKVGLLGVLAGRRVS